FGGLSVKTLDLASSYSSTEWAFGLEGTAELNKKSIDYAIAATKKEKDDQFNYTATLTASGGITAKDVAGRSIPGLDTIELEEITLTESLLDAKLKFEDTMGEIAAFHPKGSDAAVLAFSVDELGFSKLMPVSGAPLEGVMIEKPTIIMVASGGKLQPSDEVIPDRIRNNIQTVLNDLEASDPGVKSRAIPAGITLLAELDIQASSDMGALMSTAGVPSADANRFPMQGTISPAMFQPNASLGERLDGTKLKLALPDLQIPSLPGAMQLSQALLNISDKLPEDFALPEANTPASGPVVSLSARAAADSAKGLWDFQDLKATSVNFAATYSKEAWAFNLQGTAELNDTPLAYTMKLAKG
ncbi:MAG: hypothetical protein MK312_07685, partial [Roseibacillus sp.]|nr:hypothetical protein [Roseibacillus sp.]